MEMFWKLWVALYTPRQTYHTFFINQAPTTKKITTFSFIFNSFRRPSRSIFKYTLNDTANNRENLIHAYQASSFGTNHPTSTHFVLLVVQASGFVIHIALGLTLRWCWMTTWYCVRISYKISAFILPYRNVPGHSHVENLKTLVFTWGKGYVSSNTLPSFHFDQSWKDPRFEGWKV